MNQTSNRRILLLILLLIALIVVIIYHKITPTDLFNWYVAVRDFVISSKDFQFWATFVTLTGVGFVWIYNYFSGNKIHPQQTEVKPVRPDPEHFGETVAKMMTAFSQQPTRSSVTVTPSSLARVPFPRQWQRPQERDRFNRQAQAVGRQSELAELEQRLANGSSVAAVVGMAGLGKTTLASMFVQQYGANYSGGHLWTDIGFEFRQPEQCQTILNKWASWAYGSHSSDLQQHEQWLALQFEPAAVRALLSEHGPLLVVLDDVWDLDAIQPLREALPADACLLVTTRDERIATALMGDMPLNVLSPAEALTLLQQFLPHLAEERLNELAQGLGYHAQALTIAGADIRARRPRRQKKALRDLLQRVEKGQGLGDLPQLDQQNRQNTVEIAFQFSYEEIGTKMGANYQRRLRLLGALGSLADFSTETVAALWQDDVEQAIDFLEILQARSLLSQGDDEERWSQHPLLRSYSRALLRHEQELDQAERRYFNYIIDFADKGFERPMQEWASLKPDFPHLYYVGDALYQQISEKLGDLEALAQPEVTTALPSVEELDDLSKEQLTMAVQFSVNTSPYLIYHTELGAIVFNWLNMGLVSARVLEQKDREAVLLNHIGHIYQTTSHYEQALEFLKKALLILQDVGNRNVEATVLQNIGAVHQTLSQHDKALKLFNQALPILQDVGNRNGEATVLQNIGAVHQALSQHDKALKLFNQALPILREVGNRNGEATVLQNIGLSYQYLSQHDNALEFFNQALPILQDVGNRNGEAAVLQNIGLSYQYLSQHDNALEFFNQALPILQDVGNRNGEAAVLQNIGLLYQYLSQHDKALKLFNQALPILQDVGNRNGEATVLQNIGAVHQALSQHDKALKLFNQALPILQDVGNRNVEATVLQNIGAVHQTLSQHDKALKLFNQALPILQDVGNRNGEATVLQNIGAVHQALSQHDKALKLFNQALPILQDVGNRNVEATVLQNIGLVHQALSQHDKVLKLFNQALPILREVGNRYGEGMVLQNLGYLYFQAFGQFENALEYFNQALEPLQVSGNLVAIANNYHELGKTNSKLGNYPAASDDFSNAIKLQPDNEVNSHWRGATYFAVQDYPAALTDLERAIELQPSNAINYFWLGKTNSKLGNYAAAIDDFSNAIKLQADNEVNYH
jgi:tetratricopeptide (TPR) repeat protein